MNFHRMSIIFFALVMTACPSSDDTTETPASVVDASMEAEEASSSETPVPDDDASLPDVTID